jgi:hypothetical protein
LGSKDEDANLNDEVTSRLDELFGEDAPDATVMPETQEIQENPAAEEEVAADIEPSGAADESSTGPIDNLKALVFSIDWEITDATMKAFLKEVKQLKQQYKQDRMSLMFLKLHESLGKYIKSKKARAHPDAIKLVASIYHKFEKMLLSPELSESEKKKLVSREVKKYNQFKKKVLAAKETSAPAATAPQTEPEPQAAPESASEPVSSLSEPVQGPVSEPEAESAPNFEAGPAAKPGSGGLSKESRELAEYVIDQLREEIRAEFQELRKLLTHGGA